MVLKIVGPMDVRTIEYRNIKSCGEKGTNELSPAEGFGADDRREKRADTQNSRPKRLRVITHRNKWPPNTTGVVAFVAFRGRPALAYSNIAWTIRPAAFPSP